MVKFSSNCKVLHVLLVAVIGRVALLKENKPIGLLQRVWLLHRSEKELTIFFIFHLTYEILINNKEIQEKIFTAFC